METVNRLCPAKTRDQKQRDPLMPVAHAATRPVAEFSPLRRRDEFDGQQV